MLAYAQVCTHSGEVDKTPRWLPAAVEAAAARAKGELDEEAVAAVAEAAKQLGVPMQPLVKEDV